MTKTTKPAEQADKFREAARELETDDSEENFDRALKKIAGAPPKSKETEATEREK